MGGPVASPHFPQPATSSALPSVRGGILLRTLQRVADGKVISGPSLVVDEILRLSRAKNIAELVREKLLLDTSAFPSLSSSSSSRSASLAFKAIAVPASSKPEIYNSPRIGLDLSHPGTTPLATHPRVVYLSRPYRYFTHPTLLTANGRVQTFVGLHRALVKSGKFAADDNAECAELVRLSGMKRPVVEKYLAEFRHGAEAGKLKSFVGAAGKGACASPVTYLRMAGTLSKIADE